MYLEDINQNTLLINIIVQLKKTNKPQKATAQIKSSILPFVSSMELSTTSHWAITSMTRTGTRTPRCCCARSSTGTVPSTPAMKPLSSMRRLTRVCLGKMTSSILPLTSCYTCNRSVLLGLMVAHLFFFTAECVEFYPNHHPSPEDIISHFPLHFKRLVWKLFVSRFLNFVCV